MDVWRAWDSRRVWFATGALAVLLVAGLSSVDLPDSREKSICFVRLVSGLPCPGCGLTRAVSASAKGDWKTSLDYHPAALALGTEAIMGWFYWGLVAFGICKTPRHRTLNRVLIGNAAVLLAIWVVRLVW